MSVQTVGVLDAAESQQTLRLGVVARMLGVNPRTVTRWISEGIQAPDGQRVYLRGHRIGRRWLTTREAVEEFSNRLTQFAAVGQEVPSPQGSVIGNAVSRRLDAILGPRDRAQHVEAGSTDRAA